MVSVKIEVGKKDLLWIMPLVVVLFAGVAFAYGGVSPDVMGHSSGEIEIEIDDDFCKQITGNNCGVDNVGEVSENEWSSEQSSCYWTANSVATYSWLGCNEGYVITGTRCTGGWACAYYCCKIR